MGCNHVPEIRDSYQITVLCLTYLQQCEAGDEGSTQIQPKYTSPASAEWRTGSPCKSPAV